MPHKGHAAQVDINFGTPFGEVAKHFFGVPATLVQKPFRFLKISHVEIDQRQIVATGQRQVELGSVSLADPVQQRLEFRGRGRVITVTFNDFGQIQASRQGTRRLLAGESQPLV